MATTSSRLPMALSDAVWALDRLIHQANEEPLDDAARRYVNQVNVWLEQVRPLVEQEHGGTDLGSAPAFPLTATALEDLQRAVDKARRDRYVAGDVRLALVAPFLYPLDHLGKSIRHARFSSWLIAVGLVVLILINVLDLVVLKDQPRELVFGVNVVATLAVAGLWAFHHFHFLERQSRAILQHLAIHHHHWGAHL